jgi:hypothetical protein
MDTCILNVTPDEYDQILQLNHDCVVWKNQDQALLHGLETLIGKDLVEQMRHHDECRMEKHDNLEGIPRVEEGAGKHQPLEVEKLEGRQGDMDEE